LSFVGIIANPASGKDIRRLVAFGSVFDNQEKVRIVRRLLLGLTAVGVERICYMPDYFGIVPRAAETLKLKTPLFPLNFKATASQADSTTAGRMMAERGVDCIITLGGDGTNRAVAKGSTSVPLLPISTGTNNVFPEMVEGTLAGLAAGLVAQKRVPIEEAAIFSTLLEVILDGRMVDIALVDAVVCDDPFIGSRAVWDMEKVHQIFLNRAEPDSIGLSAIGGLIHPVRPEEPFGLNLVLGRPGRRVIAPVAPGMVKTVSLCSQKVMALNEEAEVITRPSVLSLDGEREVEIREDQTAAIRLKKDGPIIVSVHRTMISTMKRRVLSSESSEV
jgi:predicted polyphosphate/ATP-dependent NAD kinase